MFWEPTGGGDKIQETFREKAAYAQIGSQGGCCSSLQVPVCVKKPMHSQKIIQGPGE